MTLLGSLLDRSIVLSFDRTGFWRHARRFESGPHRDLQDRHVLLTGGTSGIGLEHARALVEHGAAVTTWARSVPRGEQAARDVGMRFTSVDLGDLESVRDAAWALPEQPYSAVVLNAGAMPWERKLTAQGHELVWASQVLGHLLLLRILRGRQLLTDDARVIWTSSGGMYTAKLDLRDISREHEYQRHAVYVHAKRAQVELAHHLAERWPELWHGSMHPGWVDTPAVAHSMPVFRTMTRPILRTWEQGADTLTWLVRTDSSPPSGAFWFDRQQAPRHLSARTQSTPQRIDQLVDAVFEATQPYLEAPDA